jgi:hypothetical protein
MMRRPIFTIGRRSIIPTLAALHKKHTHVLMNTVLTTQFPVKKTVFPEKRAFEARFDSKKLLSRHLKCRSGFALPKLGLRAAAGVIPEPVRDLSRLAEMGRQAPRQGRRGVGWSGVVGITLKWSGSQLETDA